MAFKASTISLQNGFERMLSIALQEKNYLNNWNSRLTSNITALDAVEWLSNLNRVLSEFDIIAALPGLQAYAQAQFGGATYDVASEYSTMRSSLVAVQQWLLTNIPSNSITIVNGVQVGASYTPAQTAPLKALVVSAAATIV